MSNYYMHNLLVCELKGRQVLQLARLGCEINKQATHSLTINMSRPKLTFIDFFFQINTHYNIGSQLLMLICHNHIVCLKSVRHNCCFHTICRCGVLF